MTLTTGDPLAWVLAVLLIYSIGVTVIADRVLYTVPPRARVAMASLLMFTALMLAAVVLPLIWSAWVGQD